MVMSKGSCLPQNRGTGLETIGLPRGLDWEAGALAGSGFGRELRVILRESRTVQIFRFSRRRVGATSRLRALMRPMAKRRKRAVFVGPSPVRMRASFHLQLRQ